MRMLAIDCATEACSVALFEDGALLAHDHRILGRGHAERLVPVIAALPDRGRADRIAVSRGPGSFTGVRIGIATARALALAWRSDIVGYPTPALVDAMARQENDGEVGVVMRGGHGEWFVQQFDATGTPDAPVASLAPEASLRRVTAPLVAGTEADAFVAERGSGTALQIHPDARIVPDISPRLFSVGVAPIYGRAPDAKPAP